MTLVCQKVLKYKTRVLQQSPRFLSCSLEDIRSCDVTIIGGGIVGSAIARKLKLDNKNTDVVLLEKEAYLGKHQSSHNSGVVHCGIYYKPGSLKSKFCAKGSDLLFEYCRNKNIPFAKNGKLIVANTTCEVEDLQQVYKRGVENEVSGLQLITSQKEICKYARSKGIQAIWCPNSANVDFGIVTNNLGLDFVSNGGKILFNFEVEKITSSNDCDYPIILASKHDEFVKTKKAVLCGGLQSENLSKLIESNDKKQKMLSFKVDYQLLNAEDCDCLTTNVYSVPDLNVPFLGAHFSPKLDGNVLLGPSAIPAFKIEGYKSDEINLPYVSSILTSCNFRNMVIRNFSKCVSQAAKTVCPNIQIQELQKLIPNISYGKIVKGPTAVQCQLLNNDGTFADDFVIDLFTGDGINQNIINCKFVPSPGATSALAIAEFVSAAFTERNSLGVM